MRRPSPPLVLLGSGALALVSLYLPWQSAPNGVDGSFGLLSTVGPQHVDGWSTVGNLLALAALLVIALAGLALVRPLLDKQLRLGQAALALAFLTAAVLAETRHDAQQHAPTLEATFHTAYGTYVGLAAALVALGAAAVHRRDDLEDLRYDPRAWP